MKQAASLEKCFWPYCKCKKAHDMVAKARKSSERIGHFFEPRKVLIAVTPFCEGNK